MNEITVRVADKKADFKFGLLVHHAAYEDVVTKQFGTWENSVQDKFFKEGWERAPHQVILVDEIPIGLFSVEQSPDCLFFNELQILPEYQGRGIGSEIVRGQMEIARKLKIPIRLRVLRKNKAQELYLRLGFFVTQTTDTHILMEWVDNRC